jgi:hypothetical protein
MLFTEIMHCAGKMQILLKQVTHVATALLYRSKSIISTKKHWQW